MIQKWWERKLRRAPRRWVICEVERTARPCHIYMQGIRKDGDEERWALGGLELKCMTARRIMT